uniref:Uncharacterized protein n=1 Tax=Populus trichocarpa TaxID=3694 RepID=U5G214_POPTR
MNSIKLIMTYPWQVGPAIRVHLQEPLRKEYEVFKFCQIHAGQQVLGDYREIFTPGTNSWRRMDASLPVDITSTNARVIFMENLHVLAEHCIGHSRSIWRMKTFGPSRTAKIRYDRRDYLPLMTIGYDYKGHFLFVLFILVKFCWYHCWN